MKKVSSYECTSLYRISLDRVSSSSKLMSFGLTPYRTKWIIVIFRSTGCRAPRHCCRVKWQIVVFQSIGVELHNIDVESCLAVQHWGQVKTYYKRKRSTSCRVAQYTSIKQCNYLKKKKTSKSSTKFKPTSSSKGILIVKKKKYINL